MKFEKYDSYKDSEIEWLGKIPSEWEIKTLKSLWKTGLSNGIFKKSDFFGEGTKLINVSNIYSNNFKIDYKKLDRVITYSDELKKYKAKNGDIFFTRSSLKEEGVAMAVCLEEALEDTVYECHVMKSTPNKKLVDPMYLTNLLNSVTIHAQLVSRSQKVTMSTIAQEKIAGITLSIPPIDEQVRIANHLTTKTSKIDKEIVILEQKIEKYKELKQTLIAETVLRGLDKNAPLQECDSQWIGDIPGHWSTDRLKNIFNERVGKNLDVKTGEAVTSNILSVMKDIGVINHKDKGNVGNKMAEDITNYKLVYPDDIVVNKMNVMIGSVGISKEFGALSVVYIILITKKDSYAKYYDYFFRMKAFQRSLRRIATGILEIREAVNMTLFMQEMMTKPPYEEQVEIASYLDEKTSKIDSIVDTIGKKIEVLKEFRKTLINDVVTGKVKVA